jgi:hypothetical protein
MTAVFEVASVSSQLNAPSRHGASGQREAVGAPVTQAKE